ncbi:hypothetical protein ACWGOE_07420 [Leucobacter chromiiresistens]
MAQNKLIYGTQEIRLRDDDDLAALRNRIDQIGHNSNTRWLKVDGKSGAHWLFITPGVPLSLVEIDNAPRERRAVQL